MGRRVTVEQAAILAARAYASANGYAPSDRRATGLVLAGMAIAASATPKARREIRRRYLEQLPAVADAIAGWTRWLDGAAAGTMTAEPRDG